MKTKNFKITKRHMKDFFKLIHDVAKIRRAERQLKRKVRWASFLSKTKWGKIYLLYKLGKNNNQQ